ncbi:MAG: AMP-binding protein [Actinomycetota bacterium]|nr:AMP-binding protein [Actinomycetota bacterium]
MERHLATVWEAVADAIPSAPAIVQGEARRSWADFDDRAARLGSAYTAVGLRPGSKVAQYLYNSAAYMESFYAALKVRAVPVNVNYRYLDDELLYLLENSEAEVLVFHSSLGERVERVAAKATGVKLWIEVADDDRRTSIAASYDDVLQAHEPAARISRDPDDIVMTYTGGTTGMPKGVMSKIHGSIDTFLVSVPPILGMAPMAEPEEIIAAARRLVDDDRQYASMPACPLMHGTGMGIGALPATTFGGRVVLLEGKGLDVDELWSTVEREQVNGITIVGDAFARPLLRGLDEAPTRWDLASVTLLLSAGAMFSAEVKDGLLEHLGGVTIIDYIAATEGFMGISISTKGNPAPTGRFIPNPGVKVFTEDGVEVVAGSGETGMVAIAGGIPDGYFHDDAKTAKTFQEIGGVRYSIPGDWATIEADGMISLLGRGSQCINTGGEKVFPEEVEEALKRHASVEDALVFGVPDERFGQRIVAVVSLRPGIGDELEPMAIVDGVREQLSSYKLPRQVVIVAEAPRAPNGKADYPRAKELLEIASSPRQ